MQTERRVAANPQTKPTDLGCESADRLLSSADTIAIYYYYSARKHDVWQYNAIEKLHDVRQDAYLTYVCRMDLETTNE